MGSCNRRVYENIIKSLRMHCNQKTDNQKAAGEIPAAFVLRAPDGAHFIFNKFG